MSDKKLQPKPVKQEITLEQQIEQVYQRPFPSLTPPFPKKVNEQ